MGPWRSLKMSPFDREPITFYWCSTVTMDGSILCCFWDIQYQKNIATLKGHWTWYHSIDCVWFPISFYSNFVHNMHRFWDIRLQKFCGLENRVRGPSKSLKMSPFDRAHMTSYWGSIVTMALSRVVSEIFSVEICRDLDIWVRGHSWSLKVVPFDRLGMVSY